MRLGRLREFLRWAVDRQFLEAFPKIEMVRVPRKITRTPDAKQVKAFFNRLLGLASSYPNLRQKYFYELHLMEFLFVLCTGVRRSAPFLMPWAEVDLEKGVAFMREKNGEELIILPALLLAYLKNRRERHPKHVWLFQGFGQGEKEAPEKAYKDPHALTTAFRRHQKKLGFAGMKIKPLHGFRANLATVSLDQLGMQSSAVANLLGHASFKTTEAAYLSSRVNEKRRAVELYQNGYLSGIFEGNFEGKFINDS